MQLAAWSADCLQYRMKFKSKYKTQLQIQIHADILQMTDKP